MLTRLLPSRMLHRLCAGDIVLAVDGVPVASDADDTILFGPPGSVVTLTVKKAPPDNRVLELLLTRSHAGTRMPERVDTTVDDTREQEEKETSASGNGHAAEEHCAAAVEDKEEAEDTIKCEEAGQVVNGRSPPATPVSPKSQGGVSARFAAVHEEGGKDLDAAKQDSCQRDFPAECRGMAEAEVEEPEKVEAAALRAPSSAAAPEVSVSVSESGVHTSEEQDTAAGGGEGDVDGEGEGPAAHALSSTPKSKKGKGKKKR